MPPSRAVPPPAGLDEEGRALFRSAQRLLRQAGTWNDVDVLVLEVYVLALANARACRVAAEACPIVEGRDGPRTHPGLHAAAQAESGRSRWPTRSCCRLRHASGWSRSRRSAERVTDRGSRRSSGRTAVGRRSRMTRDSGARTRSSTGALLTILVPLSFHLFEAWRMRQKLKAERLDEAARRSVYRRPRGA